MVKSEKLVLIATIGTTHGLKGEVYVNSYASNPMDLGRYILYSDDAKEFKILYIYQNNKRLIATFDGIYDIHSAEKLRHLKLYARRQDFKDEELEEDEFFNADLEELETFDLQGKYWGKICGIYDFGAGAVLEFKDSKEKKFLIPFTKSTVLSVNLKENKILIDSVSAGLDCMTKKDKNHECQSCFPGEIP
ncbi:16S rRNA processing protein RimM [Candidatus Liberibacter solanacearum]|uniref:Ribosome maturation factor RimM n=1 Tax=Candidatus Liberibacter solanacearum TaxID=556287 RepID=A0A094Z347_9HYPH|nr:ribosome maturation factor RimM [Candidatus Liberibacter solanacearum]KGB27374.1 16S rRNA processing protein RimM [Candidatus Liberibacter solanacearum]KJZ80902.1 16S rRNA processing protein RimM [Candidatus Liberibacter solanacearum]KJZ82049.1 16S rRNA processing protein RimM [Candidatus Liberibacter solanacearum]KQC49526.1 16S rRNA processing protein RimM [Candidatus Liberibacter solanacearum]